MRVNFTNGYYLGEAKLVETVENIEYYSRDGKGEMIYRNGMYVNGTWKNDKLHGNCMIIYENGDIFTGTFVNGVKHGEGTYKVKNTCKVYKMTTYFGKTVKQEFDHIETSKEEVAVR